MNEVYCIDLTTGRSFTKKFDNLRNQRLFLLKCKYSKKIKITGFTYQDEEEYLYLQYGR